MSNETVTILERYSASINSTNLRDEADRFSQTDILKAMAWSRNGLGSGLARLVSEFESMPKPKLLSHEQMVLLALTMTGTPKEKEEKAKTEAKNWFANEKALFVQRLKTLPSVIKQLESQAEKWQIPKPMHFATVCISYWLNSICSKCQGVGKEKIENTPSTSAKNCKTCRGVGRMDFPFGRDGQKMAQYLDERFEGNTRSIHRLLKGRHLS